MSARGKRIALIGGAAVILLLIATVFIVPALVNIDRYRPQAVAEIEALTGKPSHIGHLALTLFPVLSIRVDDFELDNPRGFPPGHVVKAARIYAIVDAGALLHRQAKITSLELDDPDIEMVSDNHGRWNYQNLSPPGRARQDAAASSGSPPFSLGVISRVKINHGNWEMADVTPAGRIGPPSIEVSDISSELENVDLSALSPSDSSAMRRRLMPEGPDGWMQRAENWLDPLVYAAGAAEPVVARGTLDAGSLRFGTLQGSSLRSKVSLFARHVDFQDVSLAIAGGKADGDLTLDFSRPNLSYRSALKLAGIDMARLLQSFPQSRGKMTGTLDGSVKLDGALSRSADPLSLMRGTGQASVRNGKLPSLQLNKNLMLLARLANLGPAQGDPSSFSSIVADFEIARSQIHSRNIKIIGNGVDVDGAGSMELAGAQNLNYAGTAQLAAAQTGLSTLLAGLSGATYSNGHLSLPFDLKGTLENPRFILSSMSGAKGLGRLQNALGNSNSGSSQQTPSGLLQGITGLFGSKKKPPQ